MKGIACAQRHTLSTRRAYHHHVNDVSHAPVYHSGGRSCLITDALPTANVKGPILDLTCFPSPSCILLTTRSGCTEEAESPVQGSDASDDATRYTSSWPGTSRRKEEGRTIRRGAFCGNRKGRRQEAQPGAARHAKHGSGGRGRRLRPGGRGDSPDGLCCQGEDPRGPEAAREGGGVQADAEHGCSRYVSSSACITAPA